MKMILELSVRKQWTKSLGFGMPAKFKLQWIWGWLQQLFLLLVWDGLAIIEFSSLTILIMPKGVEASKKGSKLFPETDAWYWLFAFWLLLCFH
jgi:hypothetical protein